MASSRRLGSKSSEIRAQLIDAADQILQKQGSAALTARRIADQLGLSREIVHYYFGTIEDLIVALLQRDAEQSRRRYLEALEGSDPLSVIRNLGVNASVKFLEITVLSFRYEAVRAEVAKNMEEVRRLQTLALTRHLEQRGIVPNMPPVVTHTLIQVVAQIMAAEKALGVSEGHAEINEFLDHWLLEFSAHGVSPVFPEREKAPRTAQKSR